MSTRLRSAATRLVRILGPDPAAVAQSASALAISIVATLGAGLMLASAEDRLGELPGLLLLVPAAIAQRGNVFGAMGSRLGTSIHTGTFRITTRADTLFGQNVLAAVALSWIAATWLAVVAALLARAFGVVDAMSVLDFVAVSVVGGILASLIVLLITIGLAAGSSRYGWDLDNVTAPLVTATGDLVTLPALILASALVTESAVSEVVGVIAIAIAVALVALVIRSPLAVLQRIVTESIPVLAIASTVSLIAGITVEKQLRTFHSESALLVLVPAYFGMAGALGGILASRLGTKLHLGLVTARALPQRDAWIDIRSVIALALPIFAIVGAASHGVAALASASSPGLATMIAVAVLGGLAAVVVVVAVAYYGSLLAIRFGLDPDTAGIPITNSVLDLVGAFTLVSAIVLLGVSL